MDYAAQSIPQRPLSPIERVVFTFTSPTAVFTDVLRNRSWVIAFVITVLANYFYGYALVQKVGFHQAVQNMVSRNAAMEHQLERDTPKQRSAVMSFSAKVMQWSMLTEPLLVIVFNLVLAGIFLASFNTVFATKLKYGLVFSVLIWADLINTIKPICTAIALWLGYPPANFDIQNPIGTDLGYFFPAWGNPAMKSLLFSLDVVMIWYLIVLAIGFSVVGKLKLGQAAAVVFGWFGVLVFTRIALASLGS